MQLQEEKKVLAEIDVDENIALKMLIIGGAPGVFIINKHTNRRQMKRIPWFFEEMKSLKVKKAGEVVEYTKQEIMKHISVLIEQSVRDKEVETIIKKSFALLIEATNQPTRVEALHKIKLLSEDKRTALWAVITNPKANQQVFKPLFLITQKEKDLLKKEVQNIVFDLEKEVILINCSIKEIGSALFKSGILTVLMWRYPERWHFPILLAGISSAFGMVPTTDDKWQWVKFLWIDEGDIHFVLPIKFISMIRSFIKYFTCLPKLVIPKPERELKFKEDVVDYLKEQGFSPKRRWTEPEGVFSDRAYEMQLYKNDETELWAVAGVPDLPEGTPAWTEAVKLVVIPPSEWEDAVTLNYNIAVDPVRESAVSFVRGADALRLYRLVEEIFYPALKRISNYRPLF